ncbi:MAG: alcohol dehydrogenase catalytic domain-containing protein [Candidatus Lokiarchaeota archaeon]|nr:alcohol dehydrogenase catalytic domain-containing protein [Candidatus Lokiarchaeota archaeon]
MQILEWDLFQNRIDRFKYFICLSITQLKNRANNMKALYFDIPRYLELKQKVAQDSDFKLHPYDLVLYSKDYEEPTLINENWIKVKVILGGICGSDMHMMNLQNSMVLSPLTSFPSIPGHEIVGEVIEIGDNVKDLKIGDRVICDTNLSCEVRGLDPCPQCNAGDYNLCINLDKGDISPGVVFGVCKDTGGGWGEFIVAHHRFVYKIPENISWEQALIAEPISCALHGILKHRAQENDKCVVIGCGTIGLAVISTIKALGIKEIYATARYNFQAEIAKQLGAKEVFIAKKDLHIKKLGRKLDSKILSPPLESAYPYGGGADIVYDSVGNASSLNDALRLIKMKGHLILIGYPGNIKVDWTPLISKEITIISSNIFSYDTFEGQRKRTMEIALDLISSGAVNAEPFVTHTYSLDNYKTALETANNKSPNEAIKVAFKY